MKIKTKAEMAAETAQEAEAAEAAAQEAMAAKARGEDQSPAEGDLGGDVESPHSESEWAALLDEEEEAPPVEEGPQDAEAGTEESSEPPAAEPQDAESEEQPAAEQEEEEETVPVEEKAQEVPEVPEVPQEPEATQEEARSAEEIETELKNAREAARQKLAEQFKLTEEQAEDLLVDPNKVLPELAANLYLDLFDSMMQGVQSQVPQMIQSYLQQQKAKQEADERFFSAWPQLAKPEYRPVIERIAATYQQLNPNADPERAVKEIGAQAWVALRLPIDELVRITGGGAEQVATPSAPKQPVKTGHIPANGGAAHREQPKQQLNEFGQLAEEFLVEDTM